MESVPFFIVKIYSEREIRYKAKKPRVEVSMKTDCYGNIEDITETFSKEDWEQIKKRGWFMS